MKLIYGVMLLCAGLFAGACTGSSYFLSLGYAQTNTHPAPEYANFNSMLGKGGGIYHRSTVEGQIGNDAGKKEGRSCSHSVLWLIAWGDSSIEAAKKAASLTKIRSIEHDVMGIFGFVYHRHCTVVTGS